eukprot:GHVS01056994.1.p1 GENE.GHVS01056994.1~~GHVS01056994.1.p1  ORF type:complete len:349 (+),score=73.73 GHVS01056994.1:322-1368(+)
MCDSTIAGCFVQEDRHHPLRHRHMMLAMDRYLKHKRKQRIRQQHCKEGRLLRSCAIQRKDMTNEKEEVWGEEEEDEDGYSTSPASSLSSTSSTTSANTNNTDNNNKMIFGVDEGVIDSVEYLEFVKRADMLKRRGMASCEAVKTYVDEEEGWTKVNIKHMKAFRKDVVGSPMIGKGQVDLGDAFSPAEVLAYLWQKEIAQEYDEMLAKACGVESFPNGIEILYQAFKGRYAQSGRDIVFQTAHRWTSDDRVTIGCESIRDYPHTDVMLKGYVRAFNHIAGYDIHRHPKGNVILTFIFQTDIAADAVPTWILNRVKLDQLHVVKAIRKHLHIRYQRDMVDAKLSKGAAI